MVSRRPLMRTYEVSPRPVVVGFVVDTLAVGHGFSPRRVFVGFVVGTVAVVQVSLPEYSLPVYQYRSSSAWVPDSCGPRPHL